MHVQGCDATLVFLFCVLLVFTAHSPCCVLPKVLEHFCLFLPTKHLNVPGNHNLSILYVEIEI